MTTSSAISDSTAPVFADESAMLVSLTPLSAEALPQLLANLALAFPARNLLVATPDPAPEPSPAPNLRVVSITPAVSAPGGWILPLPIF